MKAKILSIDSKLFDGEAKSVTVPGTTGEIEILDGHADSFFALKKGVVKIDGKQIEIPGGLAKCIKGDVSILSI